MQNSNEQTFEIKKTKPILSTKPFFDFFIFLSPLGFSPSKHFDQEFYVFGYVETDFIICWFYLVRKVESHVVLIIHFGNVTLYIISHQTDFWVHMILTQVHGQSIHVYMYTFCIFDLSYFA